MHRSFTVTSPFKFFLLDYEVMRLTKTTFSISGWLYIVQVRAQDLISCR